MLGLSHRPGIDLAQRLVEIAPAGLTRVFYSDSGSTATEIALKMAFQYWRQRGHAERTKFVALRTASTVTLSGRCQWAGSTCSTPSTARCCSTPSRPSRATPPTWSISWFSTAASSRP